MSAATGTRKLPPPVVGMILFIASEIMFFGGLGTAYFSLRASQTQWPPTGTPRPTLMLPAIFTACLMASSFTQHRAGRAGEHGDPALARKWMATTIGLGVMFLAGQSWEWSQLGSEGLGIDTNAFGTAFFTLTGAHGLHVIGGLAMLCAVWARLGSGGLDPGRRGGLTAATYYWHFVDIVWLAVFTALYVTV